MTNGYPGRKPVLPTDCQTVAFTSNRTFSRWNEVFTDVTIASAILDCVLHHCTVINIKGESYRLKERMGKIRENPLKPCIFNGLSGFSLCIVNKM